MHESQRPTHPLTPSLLPLPPPPPPPPLLRSKIRVESTARIETQLLASSMACDGPELFIDKKWRPTKREITIAKSSSSLTRSSSLKGITSSGRSSAEISLFRSYSQKNTSSAILMPAIKLPAANSSSLSRSSSISRNSSSKISPPKSPTLIRSLSKKGTQFTKKCTTLAKEQKARFYIMKRCVTMLICWRKEKYYDS
ncbi:hypothetical protein Dimus_009162 [Dionaea muscipula]